MLWQIWIYSRLWPLYDYTCHPGDFCLDEPTCWCTLKLHLLVTCKECHPSSLWCAVQNGLFREGDGKLTPSINSLAFGTWTIQDLPQFLLGAKCSFKFVATLFCSSKKVPFSRPFPAARTKDTTEAAARTLRAPWWIMSITRVTVCYRSKPSLTPFSL